MFRESNLSYFLLCASVYALSLTVVYQNAYETSKQMVNHNETTLLVIAHPDDESMFFGPFIIRKLQRDDDETEEGLKNKSKNKDENQVHSSQKNLNENFYLLCITQGNQDGLGNLRGDELIMSATKLGLKASHVKVMDDVRWLDGENQIWHKQSLQQLIIDEILSKNITELVTFDEYGVSGHSNHQTLHKVVRSIRSKMDFVKFYTLRSINLIQKYLAFFDFSLLYIYFSHDKSNAIYLLNLDEYLKLIDAFSSHQSQLVWFRKLYSFFSKYMYVNVINEI